MKKNHYINISSTLSEMLKQHPELKKTAHNDIVSVAKQYQESVKKIGPTKSAQGFNLTIQEEVDMGISKNTKITCSKGCSACCRTVEVIITDHEAEVLVSHAKEIGLPINTELLKIQSEPKDYKDVPNKDKVCVFLSEEGVCQVYSHRPHPCRKYHVTSPKENCAAINNPDAPTEKVVIFQAEVIASGILNATPNGRMATMLLNQLNKPQ